MRDIIISILVFGKNSPTLKSFIDLCINLSIASINVSKYRDYVLQKTGLSVKDLAYDCISDLFRETDGKYNYFNNYFSDIDYNSDNIPEEICKAKLASIVISRTNQRITEIREEFGEIYFRVKRAGYLHFSRNKTHYKRFIINEEDYIYSCNKIEINFLKNSIPDVELLGLLNSHNHSKYSVSKIIDFVFNEINKQRNYRKALKETEIYRLIADFYKSRMADHLLELEDVHYNNY